MIIAPFLADVDIGDGGTIFYRQSTNTILLERIRKELLSLDPGLYTFSPTHIFIATWQAVHAYGGGSKVHARD